MHFQLQIITRILLILATCLLLAWAWVKPGLYLTFFCLLVLLLLQLWSLLYFVNRTNRELARFLDAVAYDDFSQSFSFKKSSKSFRELGDSLNRVIQRFQQVRQEKEKNAQFLQVVLQQIPVAVLVADEGGKLIITNAAAKQLLGPVRELPDEFCNLGLEGRKIIEQNTGALPQQLAVSWTTFASGNNRQTIISMQNIRQELESREIRAWQDLIRVLAHEIMNSLTPISSLSRSASQLLQPLRQSSDMKSSNAAANPQILSDIDQAMETIARRSEGLVNFVESYRSLARLPSPKPEYIKVNNLIERTLQLMQTEGHADISATVTPPELTLFADPELLAQALINLIKNAQDAVADKTDAQIVLAATGDNNGNVTLTLNDNGNGIKPEDLKKIWIPFFSTKKAGTGIGLSLTRQIVTLHGGSIQVQSKPEEGTKVIIVLQGA